LEFCWRFHYWWVLECFQPPVLTRKTSGDKTSRIGTGIATERIDGIAIAITMMIATTTAIGGAEMVAKVAPFFKLLHVSNEFWDILFLCCVPQWHGTHKKTEQNGHG